MMKCGLCNGRREVAHFIKEEGDGGIGAFCDFCFDFHKKALKFNGGPDFKLISQDEYEMGIILDSIDEERLEGVDPERIRETFAKIGAEIADRMILQQVMES